MKALGLTSLVFGLVVVVAVQAGDEAAQKKEKAALQGLWKIASIETNKGNETNVDATLEFDKDGTSLTFTKGGDTKKGTFKVNPTGKPKEIDIKPGDKDSAFEGVYRIEKDKLTICLAHDAGDGRPSEFALKDGKNYVILTLERSK